MYGVLGIDPISDREDGEVFQIQVNSPQTVKNSYRDSKMHSYGLNDKLFTPEADRDKVKNKFNNFMRKLDVEIKITDKYLREKKQRFPNNDKPQNTTNTAQSS